MSMIYVREKPFKQTRRENNSINILILLMGIVSVMLSYFLVSGNQTMLFYGITIGVISLLAVAYSGIAITKYYLELRRV